MNRKAISCVSAFSLDSFVRLTVLQFVCFFDVSHQMVKNFGI